MTKLRIAAVSAATVASALLLAQTPAAASGSQVTIVESWPDALPASVAPGETVTLMVNITQTTYDQPVSMPDILFNIWSGSTNGDSYVAVQGYDPTTGAWSSVAGSNSTWDFTFASALTLEPNRAYTCGIRFSIRAASPAGTWQLTYPRNGSIISNQDGVTFSYPAMRNGSFTFDAPAPATQPVAPPSTVVAHPVTASSTGSIAAVSHPPSAATSAPLTPSAAPTTPSNQPDANTATHTARTTARTPSHPAAESASDTWSLSHTAAGGTAILLFLLVVALIVRRKLRPHAAAGAPTEPSPKNQETTEAGQ